MDNSAINNFVTNKIRRLSYEALLLTLFSNNIQERFHEPSFNTSLAHKHCDTGRSWISVCVLISCEVNKKRRFYRAETSVRTLYRFILM